MSHSPPIAAARFATLRCLWVSGSVLDFAPSERDKQSTAKLPRTCAWQKKALYLSCTSTHVLGHVQGATEQIRWDNYSWPVTQHCIPRSLTSTASVAAIHRFDVVLCCTAFAAGEYLGRHAVPGIFMICMVGCSEIGGGLGKWVEKLASIQLSSLPSAPAPRLLLQSCWLTRGEERHRKQRTFCVFGVIPIHSARFLWCILLGS